MTPEPAATEPAATEPRPSVRRRAATVLSAVVVAAILIGAAIAYAASRDHSGDTASGTNVSAVTVAPSAPLAEGAVAGFAVPETDPFGRRIDIPLAVDGAPREQKSVARRPGDPDWLTAVPGGLREPGGWQRVHGAVVPFSTSDGPARIRDGVPGGYAHTPQGAALAAAMSVYQVAARPGDRAVLSQRLVLTPADQARFDAGIADGSLPREQPGARTRALLAYDAFRIDSYAEDLTVVRLAVRSNSPGTARTWTAATVPMVWTSGDWRLRGTGTALTSVQISDLTGWTPW